MRKKKTAYELSRSQVSTPQDIIDVFWRITHKYRPRFDHVLDLGAGDGRFSLVGHYDKYIGIEIDPSRKPLEQLPVNATIKYGCAFKYSGDGYNACIGNPPYVRHHELEQSWRDRTASRIEKATGITPNRKCNLYIYFMFLALLKSVDDGLVSTLVPYEWVSRPSAKPLRQYIEQNRWHVDTYKFTESIFDKVMTTASISVIDKSRNDGGWSFFRLKRDGSCDISKYPTGSRHQVLEYQNRGTMWAKRGMSPGTQKIFTLTEGERVHAGLTLDDVFPCVTTLRKLPKNISRLTKPVFQKYFINESIKCWLIKSHDDLLSKRLLAYLEDVPKEYRMTSTCINREIWYQYPLFDSPQLLVSTGFTKFGPKVLINSIKARAIGSVCGVYAEHKESMAHLRDYLVGTNFEARVVPHAEQLKKIEICQLNTILNEYTHRS